MMPMLLDINGGCRAVGQQDGGITSLAEVLEGCKTAPVRLITDWGNGAVFGLSTVAGQASTAAALLEKQLRDQGVTDDLSRLLVHQSETRTGSTELAYTAVPVDTWRRYQQLAADQPQLVLMYDWVRTLLHWFKGHAMASAILLVLRPEGLDVLVVALGRVRLLDRMPIFQEEPNAWGRLGQRVLSLVEDLDAPEAREEIAHPYPLLLMVSQGAESFLTPILQGLLPARVGEIWAEAPILARSQLADAAVPVQHLDWQAVAASLPVHQAVNRPIDKAAAWADRCLPMVGVVAIALSCIIAVTSGVIHFRTQSALTATSGGAQVQQNLWQSLNTSVQQADQFSARQKDLREWAKQRLGSSKVPDMGMVLELVRNALPAELLVDEVGLVVEKDSHLVTVIGHVGLIEDPLRSENLFARALQQDGFVLVRRELLLQDGKPKFKLSMTWSAL